MADEARERYLAQLDAFLPMPSDRRAEVIEEISAHLDDTVAAAVERGDPPDAAEASAQRRLGSAADLARDLARPEQSAWRLLAAVGAGIRTGVGHWIQGFLLGWLSLLLGTYGLAAIVQLSDGVLETGWSLGFTDQGWNTLITAAAFAFGLAFAGRAVPPTVSVASRRVVTDVRPWVAAFGTATALGVLVFLVQMPQNWASVVALATAPMAFALGVYRPQSLPSRLRPSAFVLIAAFVLVPAIGLLSMSTAPEADAEATEGGSPDRGLSVVGPWWLSATTGEGALLSSTRIGDPEGEGDPYQWELNGDASLAGLRDLRVEAWRVAEPGFPRVDARYHEPFAVATIEREGRALSAELDTSSTPGVDAWELVVTGRGSDGTRYVLDAGTILNSSFHGSVWDWMVAVAE